MCENRSTESSRERLKAGPWPFRPDPVLRVPHRWVEPLPLAGYQLLFSPGGPGRLGLHLGFVRRETTDSPPEVYGYYPVGHEPDGDDTRLKLRLLLGATVPAYICTKPTQMSDGTVYLDLGLDPHQTALLDAWVQRSTDGAGRRQMPPYQFYRSNCAHWVARAMHDAASFPIRCDGILSATSVFTQVHRYVAHRLGACPATVPVSPEPSPG